MLSRPSSAQEIVVWQCELSLTRDFTGRIRKRSTGFVRRGNIQVRLLDLGKITGGIQHAKYFIVDNESVFLGSQNFDWRSLEHIHELGLRIKNADAARIYRDIFDLDWTLAESNDRNVVKDYLVQRSYTTPFYSVFDTDTITFTPTCSPTGLIIDSTLWDEPGIVRIIDSAKDEVSMQFLGYDIRDRGGSDYRVLDDAIRRAAARGVKVRLLVADWEKGTPAERSLKGLAVVNNVEVKFSDIPEWSGGYIPFARVEHCKFVLADSSAFWLGTSNAEKSYFYRVRNVGVVVTSTTLGLVLHRVFLKSWDGPYVERVEPDKKYESREHGEK